MSNEKNEMLLGAGGTLERGLKKGTAFLERVVVSQSCIKY